MELYATIAKERPQQILAVFVRDVEHDAQDLDDPTGANVSIPSPASSQSSSKTMDTAFMQAMRPKIPISRGSLPNPWTNQTPLEPLSPKRSLSELAATLKSSRPKTTRRLSKLSLSSINNGNFFTGPRSSSPTRSMSESDGGGSQPSENSSTRSARLADLTEQERKRAELQMRVYRARMQIPINIPLRIFRKPEECIEASEILDRLHVGRI